MPDTKDQKKKPNKKTTTKTKPSTQPIKTNQTHIHKKITAAAVTWDTEGREKLHLCARTASCQLHKGKYGLGSGIAQRTHDSAKPALNVRLLLGMLSSIFRSKIKRKKKKRIKCIFFYYLYDSKVADRKQKGQLDGVTHSHSRTALPVNLQSKCTRQPLKRKTGKPNEKAKKHPHPKQQFYYYFFVVVV